MSQKERPVITPHTKRIAKRFTRKLAVQDKRVPEMGETIVGSDRLIMAAMHQAIRPFMNPDQLLRQKGRNFSLYEEMHMDDKLRGIHDFKQKSINAVDWEIKAAAKGGPQTERYRDEIKSDFDRLAIGIPDVIKNLCDAWVYGFKIAEEIWTYEARWRLQALKCKSSKLFKFATDQYGNLLPDGIIVEDRMSVKTQTVPVEKVLLYVHPYVSDGNYYGTSDYQAVYRQWWSKDTFLKMRNIAVESYAEPSRIANYLAQSMTDTTKRNAMFDAVDHMHENYSIYIPNSLNDDGEWVPDFKLALLETARRTSEEFNAALEQFDIAMGRRLLIGDKLGFTDSPGGSFALGEVHFNLYMMVVQELLSKLEDLFNTQVIERWMIYNYPAVPREFYPKFKYPDIKPGATKEKVSILEIAIRSGLVNPNEEWVRPYLRLPVKDPNIVLPTPTGQAPPTQLTQEAPQIMKRSFASLERVVQGRVNFKRIETEVFDEPQEKAVGKMVEVFEEIRSDMLVKAQRILKSESIKSGQVEVQKAHKRELGNVLDTVIGKTYMEGREEGIDELKRGKKANMSLVYRPFLPKIVLAGNLEGYVSKFASDLSPEDRQTFKRIRAWARTVSEEMGDQIAFDVERILIQDIGRKSVNEITAEISKVMDEYLETGSVDGSSTEPFSINRLVRTESTRYFSQGRIATFTDPELEGFVQGMMYSAIMDDRVTEYCENHHGHALETGNPTIDRLPPAHWNCRSLWVPILRGEDFETSWPARPAPSPGFG